LNTSTQEKQPVRMGVNDRFRVLCIVHAGKGNGVSALAIDAIKAKGGMLPSITTAWGRDIFVDDLVPVEALGWTGYVWFRMV